MKNSIKFGLVVLATLFMTSVFAQSKSGTQEFTVEGLKVILKSSPKEVVNARLFVKGGTANYDLKYQGIESFAFTLAARGGTKSKEKVAFATALESVGASVYSNSDFDYGDFNLTCLKQYWDESWSLFTDAILNPAFTEKEYDLLKEQLIAGAKSRNSDADSRLRDLAMSNVFEGHCYEKIPSGTVESLEGISLEKIKKYYKNTVGKKRSFLVVVGNITKEDLEAKVKASLAKLPEGTKAEVCETRPINKSGVKVENRDIATNYLRGYMDAPKMSHPDGVAMMMAMDILRNRYFVELRTKRSLSYAPSAFYARGVINNPYNVIYISTTDPKQAMDVMVAEINKLKKEGFDKQELINKQQSFLTNYFMGLETMASQTSSLGMAELNGDWRMAEDFTERVNNVTLEDLNRVIDQYTNSIIWTYLGKEEDVKMEDFAQPINP
ncbi:MAG: pitrilysin family protein [Bacteroidota bacterium]